MEKAFIIPANRVKKRASREEKDSLKMKNESENMLDLLTSQFSEQDILHIL